MKRILIASALLLGATSAHADITKDPVLQKWWTLDEDCRGGRGEDPATRKACARRDKMQDPFTPQRLKQLKVWCERQGATWYNGTQRCMK